MFRRRSNAAVAQSGLRVFIVSPSFGGSTVERLVQKNCKGNFYTFSKCFHPRNLRHHPLYFLKDSLISKPEMPKSNLRARDIFTEISSCSGVFGLPGCCLWDQVQSMGPQRTVIIFNNPYSSKNSDALQNTREELQKLIGIARWLKRLLKETESIYLALIAVEAEFEYLLQNLHAHKSKVIGHNRAATIVEIPANEPLHLTRKKLADALRIPSHSFDISVDSMKCDAEILAEIHKCIQRKLYKIVFVLSLAIGLFLWFLLGGKPYKRASKE